MIEGAALASNDELRRLNVASHFLQFAAIADSEKADQITQGEKADLDQHEQQIVDSFKEESAEDRDKRMKRAALFANLMHKKVK